jgi:rare lipoprotein A
MTAKCSLSLLLLPFVGLGVPAWAHTPAASEPPASEARQGAAKQKPALDRSGKTKKGKASYYSRRFNGKPMADGTPMDPQSNNAASRTLPLGTSARVTNLENGKSAVVEIRDRGPYIAGRTIDVTPSTAEELGFKEQGVAPVEVAPIEVPQADGSVREGDGARYG